MRHNNRLITEDYDRLAKKTLESRAMRDLDELISQVATFDTLVLIRGESGSGKEVVARRIHNASPRATKAFIPVNCGAIPADLLESELFGLDEIGDMSLPMQVKLLRVLQERCFERVGSNDTKKCNVRILAATHRNLEEMVAEGTFREDLFYRLDVFPIEVPALRDHTDDISTLMSIFMEKLEAKGMRTPRFSSSALRALKVYGWPGNIRELENLMERLAITHAGKLVGMNDLPKRFRTMGMVDSAIDEEREDQDALMTSLLARPCSDDLDVAVSVQTNNGKPPLPEDGIDLKSYLQDIEQWFISEALRKEQGVITRAAQLLGLQRTTLAEKMKKLGVL
jgi:sigma-54 specific flagellar transcriptional regulator A